MQRRPWALGPLPSGGEGEGQPPHGAARRIPPVGVGVGVVMSFPSPLPPISCQNYYSTAP